MLPAPGQGALAVECRAGERRCAGELRAALDDPRTHAAVTCERTVLAELEAGCSAPVGALAEVVEGDDGDELWVRAVALSPDGPGPYDVPPAAPPVTPLPLAVPSPPRCWTRAPHS